MKEPIMTNSGFWKRAIALFIDYLFLVAVVTVFFFIVLYLFPNNETSSSMITTATVGGQFDSIRSTSDMIKIPSLVFFWLYFALQESSHWQATIGKRILKIYVTNQKGERLNFIQTSIRYLSKYLSSVFLIGFIMAAFTKNKQGLHDIIADTLVVNR